MGTAQNGGQAPNELVDQRDQLVSNLSQLVGISTTTDSNGALNVFVGNGQALVLQGQTTALTTVPNQFNASQLEISTSALNGNEISSSITSGDLGGLLAARTEVINPALNQLGQVATALSQTVNSQQADGLDLNGTVRRRNILGGHASGDGLLQEYRRNDGRRLGDRRGRADRGQLCSVV